MNSWAMVDLGSCISSIGAGVSISGESRPPRHGEVAILTLGAVSDGRFNPAACKVVRPDKLDGLGRSVKGNTLLMSRSNTIDLVGSTVFVGTDYPNLYLPDLIWEITLKTDSPVNPRFLADFLLTNPGRRLVQSAAMGTSGSMKKLSMRRLRGLRIPRVPENIQSAWETVRSRIDSALLKLERLVSAKRMLKRGLLQDLLIGRRRFPLFGPVGPGHLPPWGWEPVQLDQVSDIRVSTVDKHSRANHIAVRLCNYMDVWTQPLIHDDRDFMRSTASADEVERFGLRAGDVLLTKDSETREEIGESSFVVNAGPDLVLGYHCALIRPDPDRVNGQFLAAQLRHPRFRQHFVRAAQGASRYGLTIDTLRQATLWLPSLAEQTRISAMELCAHKELELLSAQICSLKLVKRGVMQKVLSGDIEIPGRIGSNNRGPDHDSDDRNHDS